METRPPVINSPYDPFLLTARQALAVFGLPPRRHDLLQPDRNLLHIQLPKGTRDPHSKSQFERRYPRPYIWGLRNFIGEPPDQASSYKNSARDFAKEAPAEDVIRQSLEEFDSVIEYNTNRNLISRLGMVSILNISNQIVPKWLRDERFGFEVVNQAGKLYVTAASFRQSYDVVLPEDMTA